MSLSPFSLVAGDDDVDDDERPAAAGPGGTPAARDRLCSVTSTTTNGRLRGIECALEGTPREERPMAGLRWVRRDSTIVSACMFVSKDVSYLEILT